MALIKCKECGSKVSSAAPSCPQCGKPIKKSGNAGGCLIVGMMFLLALFGIKLMGGLPPADVVAAPEVKPTPTPIAKAFVSRRELVNNSPWDGSVSQVEKYLKTHLNDADSVEYVRWGGVKRFDDGFGVYVSYRARNAFGAYVLEHQIFMMDVDGNVTKIEDVPLSQVPD